MSASGVWKAQTASDTTVIVVGDDQDLAEDLVEALTQDGYAVLGLPHVSDQKLLKYIELADFLIWTNLSAQQLEATIQQLPPSHRGVQCIGLRNGAVSGMTSPGVMSMFLIASLMRAGIRCPQRLYFGDLSPLTRPQMPSK